MVGEFVGKGKRKFFSVAARDRVVVKNPQSTSLSNHDDNMRDKLPELENTCESTTERLQVGIWKTWLVDYAVQVDNFLRQTERQVINCKDTEVSRRVMRGGKVAS